MEKQYYRPIARTDSARPARALTLAGGWCWFDTVEVLSRGAPPRLVGAYDVPEPVLVRLTAERPAIGGIGFDRPSIMGILNLTPDSFSDGGRFNDPVEAVGRANALIAAGADIVDIGGESTRPGSAEVSVDDEIVRTAPVIEQLRIRKGGFANLISIDTRKARVAAAAIEAGAGLVNDVAALSFDPEMIDVVAASDAAVCLMHSQGLPETMQDDPQYGDILLDVYDYLEGRIQAAEAVGISRDRILSDPGVGFGKTTAHDLALIRGLSLFHGLGCAVLLGVSRKKFIGSVAGVNVPTDRMPGTLAVTLQGLSQGVQMHRVHDVAEIAQGVRVWDAIVRGQE